MLVEDLKQGRDRDRAMELAIGGEFEAYGALEIAVLKHFGLADDSYLVDVGCGSGRLAKPLSQLLKVAYLGIDIVPELVEYARELVARPDWRFEVAEGLKIPEADGVADMVCFFSVFTHLLHEQSFVYLQEAARVLRPGGVIVFSYLDFAVDCHWDVFEANVTGLEGSSHPLNMFMSRDTIHAWAEHLSLSIEAVLDGDEAWIPLSEPVVFETGVVMEGRGSFGQSVCALRKSANEGA
ncbi:MAG: class I SAM-dependent methyltransferase [Actinomycetes bacterium]